MSGETVDLELEVKRDVKGEGSILVSNGDTECWLPRSQIDVGEADERTKLVTVTLPEWLAVDRGLV